MKKRVFAMLMAAVMAFSLVACSNKTDMPPIPPRRSSWAAWAP